MQSAKWMNGSRESHLDLKPGQEDSGALLHGRTFSHSDSANESALNTIHSAPSALCWYTLKTGPCRGESYNTRSEKEQETLNMRQSEHQDQTTSAVCNHQTKSIHSIHRVQRSRDQWTARAPEKARTWTLRSDHCSQGQEWTSSKLVWFISCRHILHTAAARLRKRTTCSKRTWGVGDINQLTLTMVSAKIRPHRTSLSKWNTISELCSNKMDAGMKEKSRSHHIFLTAYFCGI